MKRIDYLNNKKVKKHKKSMGKWVFVLSYAGKSNDIVEVDDFNAYFRKGDKMRVEPLVRHFKREHVLSLVNRMFDYVEENKL